MKIYRFKPKHEKNALFIKVLVAVGVIQIAAMLFLGGMMITQALIPQEAAFEASPPQQDVKEPEKQREVVLKKNIKRSTNAVRRINVVNPQMTNTPDLTISLPDGLGGDGDGGINISGIDPSALAGKKIDFKMPEFSLFDVKGSSDRILIAFDVSSNTMTDDMGGLDAYNVVKDEIKGLVRGLPATVMFNVMTFDHERNPPHNMSVFRSSLVPASPTNKAAFESWINPVNSNINKIGLTNEEANLTLRFPPPPYNDGFYYHQTVWQHHGVVYYYMAYQAAIEQGAGVIYFLTADWPSPNDYYVKLNDRQMDDFRKQLQKNREDFIKKGGTIVSKDEKESFYSRARKAAQERIIDPENEKRKKSGKPLWVVRDPWGVAWEHKLPEALEAVTKKDDEDFPPNVKFKGYGHSQLFAAYEPLFKKVYDERKLARPTFNMIIMLPKKGGDFTKEKSSAASRWAKSNNNGKVRVLRGAKPVSEYD